MRHLVKGRKLGRTASHRKATLSALSIALIHERRITTTVAKAKELRRFLEPLITRSKTDNSHNRREVFSRLQDKYAVTELFEEIAPAVKDRPGGYTRVLKIGYRSGDSAEMAMIELVDFNDVAPEKAGGKKKRTRRSGSGSTAPKTSARTDQEAKSEKSETAAAAETVQSDETASAKGDKEDVKESSAAEVQAKESDKDAQSSKDYNVSEVKEKIQEMSADEAKAFTEGDDRVTVIKAVEKKLDDAAGDS